MIQVDQLSIAYHGEFLFRAATFNIQRGERCGLVGRNGSGKSTLFRLLTKQESPDSGTITINKNYTIGTLNQHISFTKNTIVEEATLGLRTEDANSIYKAEKMLFGLGFKKNDLEKAPRDFSGGYQLRLHLAKVLLNEPDCLLLDEPTNYLDIVSIQWFTKFLQKWPGEFILISHDREFMDNVTTHTMGIHREKVRKVDGSTAKFFEQIVLEEEVYERTRVNLEKKKAHAQSFIDRFGSKATKAAQAQSRQKMIDKMPALDKLKDIYQLDFCFNQAPFDGKKMIETHNLSFAYPTTPLIIDTLSITIHKGEKVAIIGKNGRGKSTILRLLNQELQYSNGTLKFSKDLSIGYFGQTNIERLHSGNTIEEEIRAANSKLSQTEVKAICGLMMFSGDKSTKQISVLSGGERSRVLLGKIIATPCNMLMLDEPTHHLDMESVEALIDALDIFQGATIIVTHSELILKKLNVHKLIICHEGHQEVFLGTYQEFLEKKGWQSAEESEKTIKKNTSYKEAKQVRAELINERSRAVKPFDIKMAQIEKHITELEIEQQKAYELFSEYSLNADTLEIQNLSKAIAARKSVIEKAYNELEQHLEKREHIYASFSDKLEDL